MRFRKINEPLEACDPQPMSLTAEKVEGAQGERGDHQADLPLDLARSHPNSPGQFPPSFS